MDTFPPIRAVSPARRRRGCGLLGLSFVMSSLFGLVQPAAAESIAEVLGQVFGSASCTSISDYSERRLCEAGAVSNSGGCRALGSSSDRERCLDRAVYPRADPLQAGVKRESVDLRWPPKPTQARQADSEPLPVTELDRIGRAVGVGR